MWEVETGGVSRKKALGEISPYSTHYLTLTVPEIITFLAAKTQFVHVKT